LNKVEFKKSFDVGGYDEIVFSANNDETTVWIKNKYSCPSSTISSTITKIAGTLFEEKKWGWFFYDLIEKETGIEAVVNLELAGFEIDEDYIDGEAGFLDEEFIDHLIDETSEAILDSEYATALKNMTVL